MSRPNKLKKSKVEFYADDTRPDYISDYGDLVMTVEYFRRPDHDRDMSSGDVAIRFPFSERGVDLSSRDAEFLMMWLAEKFGYEVKEK